MAGLRWAEPVLGATGHLGAGGPLGSGEPMVVSEMPRVACHAVLRPACVWNRDVMVSSPLHLVLPLMSIGPVLWSNFTYAGATPGLYA